MEEDYTDNDFEQAPEAQAPEFVSPADFAKLQADHAALKPQVELINKLQNVFAPQETEASANLRRVEQSVQEIAKASLKGDMGELQRQQQQLVEQYANTWAQSKGFKSIDRTNTYMSKVLDNLDEHLEVTPKDAQASKLRQGLLQADALAAKGDIMALTRFMDENWTALNAMAGSEAKIPSASNQRIGGTHGQSAPTGIGYGATSVEEMYQRCSQVLLNPKSTPAQIQEAEQAYGAYVKNSK
jgi:hypothetical protein